MNREDIIRMAREACVQAPREDWNSTAWVFGEETLERFASLVVAAERNSWPAEMEAMERQVNILTDALAQAKAEEREACAKVCEAEADATDAHLHMCIDALRDCADAIRARGQA